MHVPYSSTYACSTRTRVDPPLTKQSALPEQHGINNSPLPLHCHSTARHAYWHTPKNLCTVPSHCWYVAEQLGQTMTSATLLGPRAQNCFPKNTVFRPN
jgi:hypothetical protein